MINTIFLFYKNVLHYTAHMRLTRKGATNLRYMKTVTETEERVVKGPFSNCLHKPRYPNSTRLSPHPPPK